MNMNFNGEEKGTQKALTSFLAVPVEVSKAANNTITPV